MAASNYPSKSRSSPSDAPARSNNSESSGYRYSFNSKEGCERTNILQRTDVSQHHYEHNPNDTSVYNNSYDLKLTRNVESPELSRYEKRIDSCHKGSSSYHKGSSGYPKVSESHHKGSFDYQKGSDNYNNGSSSYQKESYSLCKGSSSYLTGSNGNKGSSSSQKDKLRDHDPTFPLTESSSRGHSYSYSKPDTSSSYDYQQSCAYNHVFGYVNPSGLVGFSDMGHSTRSATNRTDFNSSSSCEDYCGSDLEKFLKGQLLEIDENALEKPAKVIFYPRKNSAGSDKSGKNKTSCNPEKFKKKDNKSEKSNKKESSSEKSKKSKSETVEKESSDKGKSYNHGFFSNFFKKEEKYKKEDFFLDLQVKKSESHFSKVKKKEKKKPRLSPRSGPFVPTLKQNVCYIVVAVIFNEDNQVLLMQEAKPTCLGKWYLPAGRLEPGESFIEGAKREVLEETGLEFEPTALVQVEVKGVLWYRLIFTGVVTGGKLKTPAEKDEESIQADWFPLDSVTEPQVPIIPLRSTDIIRVISDTEEYLQLTTDGSTHQPLLPTLWPHNKVIFRTLFIASTGSDMFYVRNKGRFNFPAITINSREFSWYIVFMKLLRLFSDPVNHELHGMLSVEHNGCVPGMDGICFNLLCTVMLRETHTPPGSGQWPLPAGATRTYTPPGSGQWELSVGAAMTNTPPGSGQWKLSAGATRTNTPPGSGQWELSAGAMRTPGNGQVQSVSGVKSTHMPPSSGQVHSVSGVKRTIMPPSREQVEATYGTKRPNTPPDSIKSQLTSASFPPYAQQTNMPHSLEMAGHIIQSGGIDRTNTPPSIKQKQPSIHPGDEINHSSLFKQSHGHESKQGLKLTHTPPCVKQTQQVDISPGIEDLTYSPDSDHYATTSPPGISSAEEDPDLTYVVQQTSTPPRVKNPDKYEWRCMTESEVDCVINKILQMETAPLILL